MRLIDADTLKKKFEYSGEWYKSRTVKQIIDRAPTVEPPAWQFEFFKMLYDKARTKGEWVIVNDVYCKCPFCDYKDVKYSNYCPDCGAELRRNEV